MLCCIGAASAAPPVEHPCPCCAVDEARIDRIMASLTLEQKIAQMYLVGVGLSPGQAGEAKRLVRELGVGGVLLRPGTGIAQSPRRTAANVARLQDWARSRPNGLPLLVACDQEGGAIQPLSSLTGGTDQPGNLGLGATFDPAATQLSYSIMGQQLYALGVNLSLAPVAEPLPSQDEPSLSARCFGQDPLLAAAHSARAVRGLESNRVIACAKYFPGRACAPGDEQAGPTSCPADFGALEQRLLPPFDAAVSAGADMIMLSPAAFPALDGQAPALASGRAVALLRQGLGFEGVIVTDDLNLAAIAGRDWNEPPDLAAIRAGADMILDVSADSAPQRGRARWPHDVAGQIAAVARAVRQGKLDPARIDQSVRRILRLKMRYCLFDEPLRDPGLAAAALNTPEQQAQSALLHAQALTVVRDEQNLLALKHGSATRAHVVCINSAPGQLYPGAAEPGLSGTTLLAEVQRIAPQTTGDTFDVRPDAAGRERIVRRAAQSDAELLVIGTYNARYYPEQARLVNDLLALKRPTIVVALGLPYDLLAFPQAGTYLATYGNRGMAVQAAARALLGLGRAEGRLPVELPGLYPAGWSANGAPQ